jgi:hypothetical protein
MKGSKLIAIKFIGSAKIYPDPIPNVDIWIDRTVVHFLTREEDVK